MRLALPQNVGLRDGIGQNAKQYFLSLVIVSKLMLT